MKKQLKITIKALTVAVAMVAAFAFTTPMEANQQRWGQESNGTWRNVTNMLPGSETYQCVSSGQCLFDGEAGDPIEDSNGQFIYHAGS